MIETGKYDNFGKENDYISIDLADKKHKNRVLDILEGNNIITDEYEYTIKAQWTSEQYHPWMTMNENDLINLSKALGKFVEKIEERKANKQES